MTVQTKSKVMLACKRFLPVLVMVCLFFAPALLFGQNPDDPSDPSENPDGHPPTVPLMQWMSLILLVAGILLSVWVIKRRNAKKAQSLVAQTVTTDSE